MKILMLTHYFASHQGGIEIVAEELFRGLSAREQEVVWMAADATPVPEPVGKSRAVALRACNFVEEKIGLPFPIPTLSALRKIGGQIAQADVVILHDCLYLSNLFAFLRARFRGVPTIVVQHIGIVPYKSRLLSAVMRVANATVTRAMLTSAGQVVFISETTRKFFGQRRFRRPPMTIFNGVDPEVYRPLASPGAKGEVRREYGLPEDRPAVLFVGRFVEKKGIAAMKRMVELRPDWMWVFAGWGPLDPRVWNAANVRVVSGLRGSSMAALYRACDLLVLPSTGEGFPLVVQEALASGLPVVCGAETLTADPAMKPFVRGVPVYAGDAGRTARGFLPVIEELLATETECQEKRAERRVFAVARYAWRETVERYLEIASRLAQQAVSRPMPARAAKASR